MKVLLGATFLFLCAAGLGAAPTVVIGSIDLPPHSVESTEASFSREFFAEVFASQGWEVRWEYYPWARALEWGKQGKVDAVWPSIHQGEREQWFSFGSPVLNTNYVLLKRKTMALNFRSLGDAKPYRIGVLRGGITGSALDEAGGFELEEATSFGQNLQKLAAGRIDLMTCDRYNGRHLLEHDFTELGAQVELLLPPISTIEFYLMFSKAAPDADLKAKAFERGLQLLRASGRWKALLKKYNYDDRALP